MKKRIACALLCAVLLLSVPVCAAADSGDEAFPLLPEGGTAVFSFSVPADGDYRIEISYRTVAGSTVTPQTGFSVDVPYTKDDGTAADMPRIWKNEPSDGRFPTDSRGNERMPVQTEAEVWQTKTVPAADGGSLFRLTAGEHRLYLTQVREQIRIRSVQAVVPQALPSYADYLSACDAAGAADAPGGRTVQEAELTKEKSHPEITVGFDRADAAVSPNDPTHLIYNTLGGSGFSREGMWASWTMDVPQDGYYLLDIAYRQNFSHGIGVHRRLFVNGAVPFAELDDVVFPYTEKFRTLTPSDKNGTPYRLYLTAGTHEIRMEVTLADAGQAADTIDGALRELNGLYSRIMVIVGETPDLYRDYDLDQNVPGLLSCLADNADVLHQASAALNAAGTADGQSGGITARIDEAERFLRTMHDAPQDIPKNMDYLRTQLNALADAITSIRQQPLELDYLVLRAPGEETSAPRIGFWQRLSFRLQAFAGSFFSDYSAVSDGTGKTLKVWVSANDAAVAGFATGRDQAQIVSQMVTDNLFAKTGVSAAVSLVSASDTLLQAIVSGKGPDVALFVPKTVLSNLYFRDALADLTEMDGYAQIVSRYYPSALTALQSGGRTFAFPDVQSFSMLFYRTDIFSALSLDPPDTWDEFYSVLKRLQKNGRQVGIAENKQIYEMFLLQNGGTMYNDDLTATEMTGAASVAAFTSWTDLYRKYGLPLSFDALSRFRTGQIPLLLANSYFYTQLSVGAPELGGAWAMCPVPGTKRADGTIDRSEPCNVSGSAVIAASAARADAYRFLAWWTDTAVQQRFARECEARVGVSARYYPADRETPATLPWSTEDLAALDEQWAAVRDIPQSPAVYFIERSLTNAFRRVVYDYGSPRDAIVRYGRAADEELTRKWNDLGRKDAK